MRSIHIFAATATVLLAGCATWTFEPTRFSKFVNERNEYILVDYGIEEHESTFIGPGGVEMPFKSKLKVRVEMPDGTRFVAYQNMSTEGRLYVSSNERWRFLEHGVAAYVAERLGLPGSPYQSVDILTHKDKFRKFLREHGFNCPQAGGYATHEEAIADFDRFRLPVMVKPTDSAGSKGVSRIEDRNALEAAVRNALAFSREKRFLIEEYLK